MSYLTNRSHSLGGVELGDLVDTTKDWVPVFHFESFILEGVTLHALVVESADGVEIGSLGKLLELLWGLVEIEKLFNAVVVLTNIVLMVEDAKGAVDLFLEAVVHFLFVNLLLK